MDSSRFGLGTCSVGSRSLFWPQTWCLLALVRLAEPWCSRPFRHTGITQRRLMQEKVGGRSLFCPPLSQPTLMSMW